MCVLAVSWAMLGMLGLFYFLLWELLWAPKWHPSKNRERDGTPALDGQHSFKNSTSNQKTVLMGGGDVGEGAQHGGNVWKDAIQYFFIYVVALDCHKAT